MKILEPLTTQNLNNATPTPHHTVILKILASIGINDYTSFYSLNLKIWLHIAKMATKKQFHSSHFDIK